MERKEENTKRYAQKKIRIKRKKNKIIFLQAYRRAEKMKNDRKKFSQSLLPLVSLATKEPFNYYRYTLRRVQKYTSNITAQAYR
jgi:hypothetical protein